MQLRNAQQEYENEGGLRNALSGGLPDDPSSLLKYGKQGRAVYESALKGRKEKLESDEKRNVMLGGLAGSVMENPTPESFKFALDRAEKYGLMTPAEKQDVLTQYGGSPELIKSYVTQIYKGSITAQAQQADATSRANNAATVAASYYGHNVSAANNQRTDARERARLQIVTGENGFYAINPFDPNSARPVGMAPPPPTPQPSINNALVNPATASTIVKAPTNSLLPTAPSQAGAPTVANAPVTQLRPPVKEQTPSYKDILDPTNPKQMITVDAKTYKGGSVGSVGVLGVAGKEPTAALREQKTIGAEEALKGELENLKFAYTKLNEAEAIPSTQRSGMSNLSASTQASDAGQFIGKVFGTTEQSLRDNIKSSNLRLLQSIKNATGMSAQELNSNMELKTWIDSLTNPKTAYETNMKNIENIENFVKKRANREGVKTPATPETSNAAPVVKSEAEYNALPSGSTYVDPDGVTRRKR